MAFILQIVASVDLPLSTSDSQIVDANGKQVKLACVNLYGAHMERYVINGLDEVDIDVLAQNISSMGFNCVRLVYSLELYLENPTVDNSSVSANPQLYGLKGMDVFDKTIESLTKAGVMTILNNHISDAIWCCDLTDGNGLWYNPKYSIYEWISTLVDMT